MRDFLETVKAAQRILWLDWEKLILLKSYRDDFLVYWYKLGGMNDDPNNQIPYYSVILNRAKRFFCLLIAVIIFLTMMSVLRFVQGELLESAVILVGILFICALAVLVWFPANYWYEKNAFRKVKILRFFTDEEMAHFERDRMALEDKLRLGTEKE